MRLASSLAAAALIAAAGCSTDLRVASDPPGAKVFVDGEAAGTAPGTIEISQFMVRRHDLRFELPGHEPEVRAVEFKQGKDGGWPAEVAVKMRPAGATAVRPERSAPEAGAAPPVRPERSAPEGRAESKDPAPAAAAPPPPPPPPEPEPVREEPAPRRGGDAFERLGGRGR